MDYPSVFMTISDYYLQESSPKKRKVIKLEQANLSRCLLPNVKQLGGEDDEMMIAMKKWRLVWSTLFQLLCSLKANKRT